MQKTSNLSNIYVYADSQPCVHTYKKKEKYKEYFCYECVTYVYAAYIVYTVCVQLNIN